VLRDVVEVDGEVAEVELSPARIRRT